MTLFAAANSFHSLKVVTLRKRKHCHTTIFVLTTLMLFRSSCHGVGQISIQNQFFLRILKPSMIPPISLTTNTFLVVLCSLKKNVKIQSVCVFTFYPVPRHALQIPGTTGLVVAGRKSAYSFHLKLWKSFPVVWSWQEKSTC